MIDFEIQDAMAALRHRIQSQAIVHRIGGSIEGHVVMRFREAGTWKGELKREEPIELISIITLRDHVQRMRLPYGPLLVVVEEGQRSVVAVKDQLLSTNSDMRLAAAEFFLQLDPMGGRWVSSYVIDLIEKSRETLASVYESEWISTGIKLHDAVDMDFRINLAGAKQSHVIEFSQCYQEYLSRIIWPSAKCFDHDRPPILKPFDEMGAIKSKIELFGSLDSLDEALNEYIELCGYLPVQPALSIVNVVERWKAKNPESDVWKLLWQWTKSGNSELRKYHVATAFIEHPEWIQFQDYEHLLDVARGIISCSEADSAYEMVNYWRLLAQLLQHYQMHLESSLPGLDGEVVATSACWLASFTSNLFAMDNRHLKSACEYMTKQVLPTSWNRWSLARSRMTPSSLREANIHNPFLWSDSLLALSVANLNDLPKCDATDGFCRFLIERCAGAACVGSLRTVKQKQCTYTFELPISKHHLGLGELPDEDVDREATRQIINARIAIESADNLSLFIEGLKETPEGLSDFLCANLRSWVVDRELVDKILKDLLVDDGWLSIVFSTLPVVTLDKLVFFVIDWQLRQEEEWFLKVPHILAAECERSSDPERQALFFSATIVSSLACDSCSAVQRLLVGTDRFRFVQMIRAWSNSTRQIAMNSEGWLTARIRGFLGELEPSFR
jgi:hypothetical protein